MNYVKNERVLLSAIKAVIFSEQHVEHKIEALEYLYDQLRITKFMIEFEKKEAKRNGSV